MLTYCRSALYLVNGRETADVQTIFLIVCNFSCVINFFQIDEGLRNKKPLLDQDQKSRSAGKKLDVLFLGKNPAGFLNGFWFQNVKSAHVTPLRLRDRVVIRKIAPASS